MSTLTLTFKTLEAARAALLEIPSSSLVGGPAPEAVDAPVVSKKVEKVDVSEKRVQKAEKIEQVVEAPKPVAAEPTAPAPVAAPAASSVEQSSAVDYPTLQKAVFALAGKSRESAAAVASSFGVKTFKELPEAKWADALTAVTAALAA